MRKRYLIFLFLILFPALALSQEERIHSFHSEIKVLKNSSMSVSEKIVVTSTGNQIKRGIYRDFPTKYKDEYGNKYQVSFKILSVTKNARPEPYHTERKSNGVRIYIGEKDVFIQPGTYTYGITYKTDRQLGFFKTYDELYWNVTGNGWEFPIDMASASVELPNNPPTVSLVLDGFSGPFASLEKNFESSFDTEGRAYFKTTKGLSSKEGLSIVLRFPKGVVHEPTFSERLNWFVRDNRGGIVGIFFAFLVAGYYVFVWQLSGKDPEAGTIIPLYEPPTGFSAQAMRYISKMGYDNKVFATAILSLAIKGSLKIQEDKKHKFTLERISSEAKDLSKDEKALLDRLLPGPNSRLELDQENHSKISDAIRLLKQNLKKDFDKKYFVTNLSSFLIGLAISIGGIIISGFQESPETGGVVIFLSIWLSGWSIGVIALWIAAIKGYRELSRGSLAGVQAIPLTIMACIFTGAEVAALFMFYGAASSLLLADIVLIASLNVIFYHLLKAPTRMGRSLLDKIEGFEMYLGVAEKDEIRNVRAPEQNLNLYEKYLPYAMAFDLENTWTEKFKSAFDNALLQGKTYSPTWYSGNALHSFSANSFGSSFGSSLTSAISSASTAPGSSGGSSGGGGSGGGGGGGGGGGW